MRHFRRGLLAVAVAFGNVTCSVNILESFADKNSNMALYYAAQKLINQGDYSGALTKIALITGEFASDRKVVMLKASAYGGLCGINFLTLVENLAGIGSTRLFPFLLGQFPGATSSSIDACITAQGLITGIGAVGTRTNDENMFLLIVSFAKIGNILSFYADQDHDGARDAGYDTEVCTAGGARAAGGNMTNADAIEIGTGMALAIEQLNALSGLVNVGSGSLTTVNSVCTALAGLPGGVNICTMTTNAQWTDGSNDATEMDAIRSLVNEGHDVGIDSCGSGGDVVACNCP